MQNTSSMIWLWVTATTIEALSVGCQALARGLRAAPGIDGKNGLL
jgi:hypothetical protein